MTEYNEVEVKTDLVKMGEDDKPETKEKELKPISGKVTKKKRGMMDRFVTAFIGPDGVQDVAGYVQHEIVMPAVKNIIADAIKGGVDGMLYGRDGVGRSSSSRGATSYGHNQRTNYSARSSYARNARQDRYAGGPQDDVQGTSYRRERRPRFNSETFIIENRDEASYVLNELRNNAEDFGFVSVADFYELIGEPSEFTDNNWGWMFESLGSAAIRPSRNGFVVVLPPVEQL